MSAEECRKELKPCPFCGGEAFLNQPSRHEFTVTCKKFCVKLPVHGGYTSIDNAITAWNSRTESKPVTREEIATAFFRKFRMVPENEIASFDRAFDAIHALIQGRGEA